MGDSNESNQFSRKVVDTKFTHVVMVRNFFVKLCCSKLREALQSNRDYRTLDSRLSLGRLSKEPLASHSSQKGVCWTRSSVSKVWPSGLQPVLVWSQS